MTDEVTIKVSSDKHGKKKVTTTKKKVGRPKSSTKPSIARTKKEEKNIEKILIENFIEMQKVMTHMAEKFDKLTHQTAGLLTLFEDSAKALTEKEINLEFKGGGDPKEVIDKLNRILNQNKLIAKGLTLMHETASSPHTDYAIGTTKAQQIQQAQPMQQPAQIIKTQTQEIEKPTQPMQQPAQPQMMPSPETQMQQTFPAPQFPSTAKKPTVMEEPENTPFKSF